jgi:hypothetical protein
MNALEKTIRIMADPEIHLRRSQAKMTGTCKICGNPAERFRDAVARFEYEISAICQDCQDEYFHFKCRSEDPQA